MIEAQQQPRRTFTLEVKTWRGSKGRKIVGTTRLIRIMGLERPPKSMLRGKSETGLEERAVTWWGTAKDISGCKGEQ